MKRKKLKFVFGIILTIIICIFAYVEVFDDKLKHIISFTKNYDDHRDTITNIERFEYDLNKIPDNWNYIYIPDNIDYVFNLKEFEVLKKTLKILYVSDKDYIEFLQRKISEGKFDLGYPDNEKYEIIISKDKKGYYVTDEEVITIVFDNNDFAFQIKSNLNKDELIKNIGRIKILGK